MADAIPPVPPPAVVHYLPGAIRLLVPPTHPPVAAKDNPEVAVELTGTVRIDGTLANVKLASSSEDPAYRNAVQEVSSFWLFTPALRNCEFVETDGAVTLWFEKKDGEPKVSYSIPQAAKAAQLAAAQELPKIDALNGYDATPLTKKAVRFPKAATRSGMDVASFFSYVKVEPDGTVSKVSVAPARMKGAFEKAIQDAVLHWTFRPSARSWCGELIITFKLV